ncbi:MAG: MBL fold metallo-hydrolase [Anaeroplasma bactoclasticum]|nr:MBL fold metallo-hydrolase [Anaeroplasma bactoclasticum]
MAIIRSLASGSSGNCYIVSLGSSCYILDAGLPINQITQNVNLNDIDFAFISHNHKDHSRSAENLASKGVEIVRGNLIGEFKEIAPIGKEGAQIRVFCFPLEHGEEKNSGIIIFSQETRECLLYATDFSKCKSAIQEFLEYYIPGAKITHIMVECNYLEELIEGVEDIKTRRQINTHMGLAGLQKFLNMLDLSKCKEIILTHMSQNYGDAIIMASTIYSKYRIRTGICKQWGGIDYYG